MHIRIFDFDIFWPSPPHKENMCMRVFQPHGNTNNTRFTLHDGTTWMSIYFGTFDEFTPFILYLTCVSRHKLGFQLLIFVFFCCFRKEKRVEMWWVGLFGRQQWMWDQCWRPCDFSERSRRGMWARNWFSGMRTPSRPKRRVILMLHERSTRREGCEFASIERGGVWLGFAWIGGWTK